MYRLGIIEESVDDRSILSGLMPYFVSQRTERVSEDECPVWHINEYHVAESEIADIANMLKNHIKQTWYCHAFNDEKMFVVLKGRWFQIALKRDESWDEMIAYGVTEAKVERGYLETIPLHI